MKLKLALIGAAVALSFGLTSLAHAKTFKWSSASDIPTLDIHSQNNALGNGVHASVYDALVYYNSNTFKAEPQLATSWRELSPTQMRFTLRQGVKFSDGSALTADDVVFSMVSVRQLITQVPAHAKDDDLLFEVSALEQVARARVTTHVKQRPSF